MSIGDSEMVSEAQECTNASPDCASHSPSPADECAPSPDPIHRMLVRLISDDRAHFRHQLRGEAPLNDAEKLRIAQDLYDHKPGVFLERFGNLLCWDEDRDNFVHLRDTQEVVGFFVDKFDHSLPENRSSRTPHLSAQTIRNRRINALQRLERGTETNNLSSDHFSHEAMRRRDPILWESMVGRHLDSTARRHYLGRDYATFSGFLHSQLMEQEEASDLRDAKAKQDADYAKRTVPNRMEDSETGSSELTEHLTLDVLEGEFIDFMKLRFISGGDTNFDYSQIDNNDSLDDDVQQQLDEEERYFDAD